MSKVLITGASGFVGINLISYLKKRNFDILSFSRNNGQSYNSIDSIFLNTKEVDVIVHLAGKAHDFRKSVNPQEYFEANTELTIQLFQSFLSSKAKLFIYISSIKALADYTDQTLTEEMIPSPLSDYGKSKLAAEQYLLNKVIPEDKKIYILRPCMIHGPGNKGNLNLLYQMVLKGVPYPLASFDNIRSFLSIENLCFVIHEFIRKKNIKSGIFHVCDDEPVSTITLIKLISDISGKKVRLLKVPRSIIRLLATIGDFLPLPLNTERLQKMTENYLVSNAKVKDAINKSLPIKAIDGLKITINEFNRI